MYLHLPERILRQFRYLHGILRDPIVASHATIFHKDVDGTFVDYDEHLLLKGVCNVPAPHPWSMICNYV